MKTNLLGIPSGTRWRTFSYKLYIFLDEQNFENINEKWKH